MFMKFLFSCIFLLLSNILWGQSITTFSSSYGLTGYNLDQPEVQFNLETTYESNERFTQLYRWRYTMGDYKGLIFEYNNRIYFGKDRDYDNSKWFLQGKLGYGLLKGQTYLIGSIPIYNDLGEFIGLNSQDFEDKRSFVFDYGLSLGYKFIFGDRLTLDCFMGYVGYTMPNFQNDEYRNTRIIKWQDGLGAPFEFHWSLGFFLD